MIFTRNYIEPPFCEKEILRYAGCSDAQETGKNQMKRILDECVEEVQQKLTYKVCYMELPISITEDTCDFECMRVESKHLAKNLQGCKKVVVFAATIGVEIDRLIAKYGRLSPSKALMLQAIGAERIEALCDAFCVDLEREYQTVDAQETDRVQSHSLKPRFSPGYGDLPLEIQKDIFQMLDCSKRIGVSLNDSLLMSPSKSVTAFVGIREIEKNHEDKAKVQENMQKNKCAFCNKTDCAYREL